MALGPDVNYSMFPPSRVCLWETAKLVNLNEGYLKPTNLFIKFKWIFEHKWQETSPRSAEQPPHISNPRGPCWTRTLNRLCFCLISPDGRSTVSSPPPPAPTPTSSLPDPVPLKAHHGLEAKSHKNVKSGPPHSHCM